MSMDFSIKPVGAPAATHLAQPLSEAADKAVATELPASQSVTVADASAGARNDFAESERLHIASGVYRPGRGLDRLSGGRRQDQRRGPAISG